MDKGGGELRQAVSLSFGTVAGLAVDRADVVEFCGAHQVISGSGMAGGGWFSIGSDHSRALAKMLVLTSDDGDKDKGCPGTYPAGGCILDDHAIFGA